MVTNNQAMKKYKYVTVSACHNIDLIANVGTIMIKKKLWLCLHNLGVKQEDHSLHKHDQ